MGRNLFLQFSFQMLDQPELDHAETAILEFKPGLPWGLAGDSTTGACCLPGYPLACGGNWEWSQDSTPGTLLWTTTIMRSIPMAVPFILFILNPGFRSQLRH